MSLLNRIRGLTGNVADVTSDNELKVNSTTASDELDVFNGQDHQRVSDPVGNALLRDVLAELKKMNEQLSFITGEEL